MIPTNSAEKTNIVLKAGQRVMVLKSPKGIYMQLESGKIIAIKTSFKGMGQKGGDNKDSPIGKKGMSARFVIQILNQQNMLCNVKLCFFFSFTVLGSRPSATNIPGSLKNNSAITITSKVGPRPGYQRVLTRPMGQNKMVRPMLPGQKIAEIRNRLGELRAFSNMRPRSPVHHGGRLLRPSLPGSVSITKIPKDTKKSDTENSDSNATNKMDVESEDDTHVLDSDDEESNSQRNPKSSSSSKPSPKESSSKNTEESKPKPSTGKEKEINKTEQQPESSEPLVLTTDEKLPSEEALENKNSQENTPESSSTQQQQPTMEQFDSHAMEPVERKTNLLKNYRHQRPGSRPQTESSLTQLERTASTLTKESMPDFRRNLDDITQSYSPNSEERPGTKSKKKKSPSKSDAIESQISERQPAPSAGMSHSVSSLLGPTSNNVQKPRKPENTAPVAPIESSGASQRLMSRPPMGMSPEASMPGMSYPHGGHVIPGKPQPMPATMGHGESPSMPSPMPGMPHPQGPMAPGQPYPPANAPPDASYGQYPGKLLICLIFFYSTQSVLRSSGRGLMSLPVTIWSK